MDNIDIRLLSVLNEALLTLKLGRYWPWKTISSHLNSYMWLYVVYSKLGRGKLFNRKRKPHTMSEKRHKINKFANYENIKSWETVPPSTAMFLFLLYGFWRNAHDQYTNPLARPLLIALQVVRTSFGFHLRECMGSSFPTPDFDQPHIFYQQTRILPLAKRGIAWQRTLRPIRGTIKGFCTENIGEIKGSNERAHGWIE